MKEIRIPQEDFNLEAFFRSTVEFLQKSTLPEVDPTHGIVWVNNVGAVPIFGPESGLDMLSVLKEDGDTVFFPFAYNDEGTMVCEDRITYLHHFSEESFQGELPIADKGTMGYLVQIQDGTVIINSAINAGGGCTGKVPCVDLSPDWGFLDKAMESFIRTFTYDNPCHTAVKCGECGCSEGELHELGCSWEICPFCGGQLVTWDCRYEILGLMSNSKCGKEDYAYELSPEQEDQWVDALFDKGRRPFMWWPVVCARCGKLNPDLFMVPDEDWEKYIDPNERSLVICRDCYLDIRRLIDRADQ